MWRRSLALCQVIELNFSSGKLLDFIVHWNWFHTLLVLVFLYSCCVRLLPSSYYYCHNSAGRVCCASVSSAVVVYVCGILDMYLALDLGIGAGL